MKFRSHCIRFCHDLNRSGFTQIDKIKAQNSEGSTILVDGGSKRLMSDLQQRSRYMDKNLGIGLEHWNVGTLNRNSGSRLARLTFDPVEELDFVR